VFFIYVVANAILLVKNNFLRNRPGTALYILWEVATVINQVEEVVAEALPQIDVIPGITGVILRAIVWIGLHRISSWTTEIGDGT